MDLGLIDTPFVNGALTPPRYPKRVMLAEIGGSTGSRRNVGTAGTAASERKNATGDSPIEVDICLLILFYKQKLEPYMK